MKVLVLLSLVVLATACRTNPDAVNSNYDVPVLRPMAAISSDPYVDRLPTAISGTVLLMSEVPRPLYRTKLALYKIEGAKKHLISEFSSDSEGAFQVTRSIEKGVYELKIADPRYVGSMQVSLMDKPATGILLEVQEAKKK